jgi:hypothetical protein
MQIFGRRFAEPVVLWHNAFDAQNIGLKRIDIVFSKAPGTGLGIVGRMASNRGIA